MFFFFQAEDGIRYLVRSRGLGDVYKRQVPSSFLVMIAYPRDKTPSGLSDCKCFDIPFTLESVSYTHLTLPTSDLV